MGACYVSPSHLFGNSHGLPSPGRVEVNFNHAHFGQMSKVNLVGLNLVKHPVKSDAIWEQVSTALS